MNDETCIEIKYDIIHTLKVIGETEADDKEVSNRWIQTVKVPIDKVKDISSDLTLNKSMCQSLLMLARDNIVAKMSEGKLNVPNSNIRSSIGEIAEIDPYALIDHEIPFPSNNEKEWLDNEGNDWILKNENGHAVIVYSTEYEPLIMYREGYADLENVDMTIEFHFH